MDELFDKAYQLQQKLLLSPQYKHLMECENQLLLDEKAHFLILTYQNNLKKYGEENTQENLKLLHQAKLEMDLNEVVIKYQKAYKEYQILINEITDLVFNGFSKQTLIDKIIRAK